MISQDDLRKIIVNKDGSQILVKRAEDLGKQLVDERLKSSQIRAIFDEVRQIESLWLQNEQKALHKVYLLKPKLAYRAARSSEGVPTLKDILSRAIDIVVESPAEAKERFRRFTEFFEAILAYHKAYGGRD
ncbi:MAG: type III-A CRISPR-associated protein Csm2 [Candidatus Latescibacterota bacterium]|nr:MAG: type III-A CRISPR-associated protein Csm2 [Candidatus Latescibacterota bacterium]